MALNPMAEDLIEVLQEAYAEEDRLLDECREARSRLEATVDRYRALLEGRGREEG